MQYMRYFVADASGRRLGCLMFEASGALACRDEWIGWTERRRDAGLELVVRNSRFLILPWAGAGNLASRALSLATRVFANDGDGLLERMREEAKPPLAAGFKNALAVVAANLEELLLAGAKALAEAVSRTAERILAVRSRLRPNRSCPRRSMKPVGKWARLEGESPQSPRGADRLAARRPAAIRRAGDEFDENRDKEPARARRIRAALRIPARPPDRRDRNSDPGPACQSKRKARRGMAGSRAGKCRNRPAAQTLARPGKRGRTAKEMPLVRARQPPGRPREEAHRACAGRMAGQVELTLHGDLGRVLAATETPWRGNDPVSVGLNVRGRGPQFWTDDHQAPFVGTTRSR
ncbi:MAG: DUF4338 domain-containing protein [Albidovulum sp.]|nr:DUF4338 domain-containing protein [Albidovulum sp.]